jgi:hypothetical protein
MLPQVDPELSYQALKMCVCMSRQISSCSLAFQGAWLGVPV